MVKMTVLQCDSCGRTPNDGVEVWSYEVKRSDGRKAGGDLCADCWEQLVGFVKPSAGPGRRTFHVVDFDDIPSNAPRKPVKRAQRR